MRTRFVIKLWSGDDMNETLHQYSYVCDNCWKGFEGQRSKFKVTIPAEGYRPLSVRRRHRYWQCF